MLISRRRKWVVKISWNWNVLEAFKILTLLLLFSISHSHACSNGSMPKNALKVGVKKAHLKCVEWKWNVCISCSSWWGIIIVWFLCWTMKLNLIESTNWMYNDCTMPLMVGREILKRIESEFNSPSACDLLLCF